MASYAPLLVNLNHRAWNPDLINFDSSRWYGLPSYYVQKLFSENCGDVVLPTKVESGKAVTNTIKGRIGVGTWNTEAEFSNIKVTGADGKVLFASEFSDTNGWKFLGGGKWTVQNGALQQNAQKEFVRAIVGDKSWTDYTIELRARKLAGREGFLVLFGIGDDEDRNWWNIGGWANTGNGIEYGDTRDRKGARIEANRWYDIKVQTQGTTVKCWLDGKLIHDIKDAVQPTEPIYASSSLDKESGEVIVKLVNAASEPADVGLILNGAKPGSLAKVTVLSSASPKDENSIDEPEKVVPKSTTLSLSGNVIKHTFPANSFAVLRIPGTTASARSAKLNDENHGSR
jgi:alpha-L-arabinofuranosidase